VPLTTADDVQVGPWPGDDDRDVAAGVRATNGGAGALQTGEQGGVGVPVSVVRTDADQDGARADGIEEARRCVARAVVRWILSSCTPKWGGP
jgi:hypothetical protein